MKVLVDRSDVERFRELVAVRLGLHFDDAKLDFLADTLRERTAAAGCGPASYLDRLAAPAGWREESGPLAEALTVTETFFFRNGDHFRALLEAVLPSRATAPGARRELRILSAGCASGEEPYSLAILLRERLPALLAGCVTKIVAVELNPAMLRKAEAGRYSEWALRETPADVQERWFRAVGRDFQLDPSLRATVAFEPRNLVDEDLAFWQAGAFDVVFCRNVIMYFRPDVARAVVARIARALVPGGVLFLGHAETLRGLSEAFHLRHTHGTFYYERRGGTEPGGAPEPQRSERAPAPGPAPAPAPHPPDGSWVNAIQDASDRIARLAGTPGRASTFPDAARVGGGPVRASAVAPRGCPDLGVALELLRAERFSEALDLLHALPPESLSDPDAQLLRAVLLTNAGARAEAEAACARILEVDELNAGARYLMALCREQAGDLRAAVEQDQAAIYLDPGFAMARVHLGRLARRSGDVSAARRELGQALVLLPREDASRILLFGGGFSREALVGLCGAELAACGGAP